MVSVGNQTNPPLRDHAPELKVVMRVRDAWSECFHAEPQFIWDVGSRDATQLCQLLAEFPIAQGAAFEPNPDTFDEVDAASQRDPRITAMRLALTDVDGWVTFMKIDPDRTQTTWKDGNPGASSLFAANGDYPLETYIQVPVTVEAARAATLIDSSIVAQPSIIWMDVQGAELKVLSGLGEHLSSVGIICVELSLDEIYTGQALASDVVAFLHRSGFYWHSCPTMGTWQFDAIFVNSNARSDWRLRHLALMLVRDVFLRFSLRSRARFGIEGPLGCLPRMAAKIRGRRVRS